MAALWSRPIPLRLRAHKARYRTSTRNLMESSISAKAELAFWRRDAFLPKSPRRISRLSPGRCSSSTGRFTRPSSSIQPIASRGTAWVCRAGTKYIVITKSWVSCYDFARFFVTSFAARTHYFSMGARRLGYMRRSSAVMLRPPMAAMGPLSRCQSSGKLLWPRRDWDTDRTLGKSILNQIPTSAAAPRLCDVPPTATIPSLRIFEHVAESGEALGERYERLHRGLVQAFDAGRLRCGRGPRRKAQCFHCRLDYAGLFRSLAARFAHHSATL